MSHETQDPAEYTRSPSTEPHEPSGEHALPEEPPRVREGLPPGFRMRHESHFVEQMDGPASLAVLRTLPLGRIDAPVCEATPALEALARSIRRLGIVEPLVVRRRGSRYQVITGTRRLSAARLADLAEVPCLVRDDLDEEAIEAIGARPAAREDERPPDLGPAARDLAIEETLKGLEAARACIDVTMPRGESLRARTAQDLVRAELVKASQTLEALRLLASRPVLRRTRIELPQLVERVLARTAPLLRLSQADVAFTPAAAAISASEPQAAFAVEACLTAAVSLGDDQRHASRPIAISIVSRESGFVSVAIRSTAWLSVDAARRLTDPAWPGHPAGSTTAMALAAAERVARWHDGSLEVLTDFDGFTIAVAFPAAP